ncbi:MAG TPA: COX15/CtaA family protein [Anaerolineae bacterium]|nr:COX15/CtaA family protein [Anaerolineae bacterium]
MPITINRYAAFAWGTLLLNIFVILWGAFVRATGSGAGCGSHWPSCNGEVIPWSAQTETLIEFTHRITSGLALIAVVILLVWAMRSYPKGHVVRLGAKLSLAFLILEALLGAGLVLFELVAYNDSVTRAVVGALHLVNTFLLLSVLTLTAWWASGRQPVQWRGQGWLGWAIWAGFVAILFLGASGAVTALGDTLFPATSLVEGLREKFSPTAHFLVRLRLYHPILAIVVGAYLIMIANLFNFYRSTLATKQLTRVLTGLYIIQLLVGAFNVVLLAPIWMQLIHLFLADLVLIVFVLFMAAAFAQHVSQGEPIRRAVPQAG